MSSVRYRSGIATSAREPMAITEILPDFSAKSLNGYCVAAPVRATTAERSATYLLPNCGSVKPLDNTPLMKAPATATSTVKNMMSQMRASDHSEMVPNATSHLLCLFVCLACLPCTGITHNWNETVVLMASTRAPENEITVLNPIASKPQVTTLTTHS